MYAIKKHYGAKHRRVQREGGGGDTVNQIIPVSAARKTRAGSVKKRKGHLIGTVRSIVSLNPRKSMRKIVRQVGVSPRKQRRIVHQYLGLKSYVLRVKQLLTEEMKKKCVEIGWHLLNSIKRSGREKIRIFRDEKMFTTDQKTNGRSARYIGIAPRRSPWSCGVNTLWSDGFMGGLK